jgi:murein DD-endopeptidase MepM/ murein hydrolase activator NlpD
MISRRTLLVGGSALTMAPLVVRADGSRLDLTGSMEQGTLIVGRTERGARVVFDAFRLNVSPDGIFACGMEWDRTKPAHLSATFSDGTTRNRDLIPIVRQYPVQRVTGLPPSTVSPSPEELERIGREHEQLVEARKKDSDAVWFAEPFDWPAPGILSGVFGSQRIDNGKPMSPHFGVDVANAEGTPIHAPADAAVSISDDYYLEGGFTLLDHGHGVSTSYLHQSSRLVKPGETVQRGQMIGRIGKTGRATGPHLHWAMNWFQVRLDPSRSTRTGEPPRS